MKLADGLLRRKELQEKVAQVRKIQETDMFEVVFQRKKINEEMDDLTTRVPKLELSQVTAEYDYYASQLRRIDGAIQQANWNTELEAPESLLENFPIKQAAERKEIQT